MPLRVSTPIQAGKRGAASPWRLVRIAVGILMAPVLILALGWAAWPSGSTARRRACSRACWRAGSSSRSWASLALVRPLRRGLVSLGVLWLVVLGWWLGIAPRNDRDWQVDVAHLPSVTRDGHVVVSTTCATSTIASETDFTEHWEDRTYDLSRVRGVDMFVSYWGPTCDRAHHHELGIRRRSSSRHLDRDAEGEGRNVLGLARVLPAIRALLRGGRRA